jgi:CRP-like cAMP-binding protein
MGSYRPALNGVLASLSGMDLDRIRADARTVPLSAGVVIAESGQEVPYVCFPHKGIISTTVPLSDGETIEVGMVGSDSMFGAGAALSDGISSTTAIVHVPGCATIIDVKRFQWVVAQSPALRAVIIQHQTLAIIQAEQLVACSASHGVISRVCRRLLRMRDLAQSDSLPVTQEMLARLLGVRRNSVSLAASELQNAGIIRYARGRIEIIDLQALIGRSCECYEAGKTIQLRLNGVSPHPLSALPDQVLGPR